VLQAVKTRTDEMENEAKLAMLKDVQQKILVPEDLVQFLVSTFPNATDKLPLLFECLNALTGRGLNQNITTVEKKLAVDLMTGLLPYYELIKAEEYVKNIEFNLLREQHLQTYHFI